MSAERKYQELLQIFAGRYPVLAKIWDVAPSRFGAGWVGEFIQDVETLYGPINASNPQLDGAIDGYAEFATDALRSQVFYNRFGRYPLQSHAEAAQNYYHNEDHMMRCYLPGMFLSHHLWPQHYNMLTGFRALVLPRVNKIANFFEVGVGCGVYSRVVLQSGPDIQGFGFDISRHSLNFTYRMLGAFGLADRYRCENRDIALGYPLKTDFLVCQEVLEHLENPAEFCRWLFDMVRPGGHAYITGALNAAHSDHIYLFREPREMEAMLRAAGFEPLHTQEEFAGGGKERAQTPSLAAVLSRRPE